MLLSTFSRLGRFQAPGACSSVCVWSPNIGNVNNSKGIGEFLQFLAPSFLCAPSPLLYQQARGRQMKNKHWNPKFKTLRNYKVIKIELPDFQREEKLRKLSPEELRTEMKKKGLIPPTPWNERQFEISSTSEVFEPYVPPEGDGKASIISAAGAKQTAIQISKKSKSMLAVRKIRTFDEDFDHKDFGKQAAEIYIKMHEAMVKQDRHELRLLVTEKAYPEILYNLKLKTMRWQFLETLEPPRVSYARCVEVISKENIFAQLTCRFHTKQTLAIYDRFGRLMFGNELTPKDVLEYVVFEKHLSNQYGNWRIHGKIIPEWKGVGLDLETKRTVVLENLGEQQTAPEQQHQKQ